MTHQSKTQNAYEILHSRMQPMIASDCENKEVELPNGCEFCLRTSEELNNKGVVCVDSYKFDNYICKTCNIFVEKLPTVLGFERNSIGYKLSSFKGGLLAVPVDEKKPVELWVGGKYLDRVVTDGAFKIVDCTGNSAKFALCESIGEYSVVTEISLRREMFLRHVKRSTANNLYISTETGVVSINAAQFKALKEAFILEDMSSKKLTEAVVILNSLKTNRIDILHKDVQALLGEFKAETRQAIAQVVEPSSILFMLAALRAGLTQK
ncbi:MAG: hypothetical protein J6N72_05275 [Psychrobacter sp.]|nr:hypothetical protein [Psychrobacter sp.]